MEEGENFHLNDIYFFPTYHEYMLEFSIYLDLLNYLSIVLTVYK